MMVDFPSGSEQNSQIDTTQVPWRRKFDYARTPYSARVALGAGDPANDGNLYGRLGTAWATITGILFPAWSTFTPAVTANVGTFTTVSGSIRYRDVGKTRFINVTINVTTNGTAAGYVICTLPSGAAKIVSFMPGRENVMTGKTLNGAVLLSPNSVAILNYDNTYPAADGSQLILQGSYELA